MQFYYEGRRQLQPLVRLRTDNGRSDPSLARHSRGTHRMPPCTAAPTPTGSTLGFVGRQPPPAAYGTFISETHQRTRARLSDPSARVKLARWGSQQNAVAV